MDNKKTVLEIKNLNKVYGDKKVLDNVSFTVNQGEIVGFLGPNGAGKSTTMNIITGYLSPTNGEVCVCDVNVLEDPKTTKSKIGYLPELPPLYFDMTVYEYLCFVFELKKCKLDKKKHIAECMALVKITHVAHRLIKNLSKGYKQRVGVAQALIGNPEILILDEPTVGLDPAQIMEIRDVIRYIGKTKTIILSTHILQEVTAVCDKVIIINQGKIKACDSLSNLENSGSKIYKIKVSKDYPQAEVILSENGFSYKKVGSDESDMLCYHVAASGDRDIRAELFAAFSKNNIPLCELVKFTKSIEDVFREYTNETISDVDNKQEVK